MSLAKGFALSLLNSTESTTWGEGMRNIELYRIKSFIPADPDYKQTLYPNATSGVCGGYSFYKVAFSPFSVFSK